MLRQVKNVRIKSIKFYEIKTKDKHKKKMFIEKCILYFFLNARNSESVRVRNLIWNIRLEMGHRIRL